MYILCAMEVGSPVKAMAKMFEVEIISRQRDFDT